MGHITRAMVSVSIEILFLEPYLNWAQFSLKVKIIKKLIKVYVYKNVLEISSTSGVKKLPGKL